jgi:hypothetical protein
MVTSDAQLLLSSSYLHHLCDQIPVSMTTPLDLAELHTSDMKQNNHIIAPLCRLPHEILGLILLQVQTQVADTIAILPRST